LLSLLWNNINHHRVRLDLEIKCTNLGSEHCRVLLSIGPVRAITVNFPDCQ
jgi:hypothetical protein